MKKITLSLTALALAISGTSAVAQGLLSLRPAKDEFDKRIPFTITVNAGVGYDSNTNLSATDEQDSIYSQFGIGLAYSENSRTTSYGINLGYGGFYYWDAPEGTDDYLNSVRLGANIRHRVNPRLAIMDNAYVAYEFEPNYAIGSGTTRRSEPYTYWYNDLSASYAWSRTLSTVTGYTISGIDYSEDSLTGESFMTHIGHHEFRYQVGKLTVAALTYRFATTSYDNDFGDYNSHYALVGIDHTVSRRLYTSFRVGAEFRDRDNGGMETAPYFESVVNYRSGEDTTLSWYNRFGFEDSSIGSYQDRYSFRSGLSASHKITNKLNGNAGLHYIHDQYELGGDQAQDFNDNVFSLSLGLDYLVYKNVSLYSGYSFTTNASGQDTRDYNRHNVNFGVRATF